MRLLNVLRHKSPPPGGNDLFYGMIAQELVEKPDFGNVEFQPPQTKPADPYAVRQVVQAASVVELATCFITISSTGAENYLEPFLRMLAEEAPNCHGDDVAVIFLPFLGALLRTLSQHDIPRTSLHYPEAVISVLQVVNDKYIGQEPQAQKFSVPPVNCICYYCQELNHFLRDASQRVYAVDLCSDDCMHLHQNLDACGFDGTHTTSHAGISRRRDEVATLVMTKRDHSEKLHNLWRVRGKQVRKLVRGFDLQKVKTAVGQSEFDRLLIMLGIVLRQKLAASVQGPLQSISDNGGGSGAAGIKRKSR